MNLVLRYLGKMEEKRGNKQQHQKNQDDHNYTAKLWNRIYFSDTIHYTADTADKHWEAQLLYQRGKPLSRACG